MTDSAHGIYEALGVRPVINACATVTRLGGSRMPPEVVAAMAEAAHRNETPHHANQRRQTLHSA